MKSNEILTYIKKMKKHFVKKCAKNFSPRFLTQNGSMYLTINSEAFIPVDTYGTPKLDNNERAIIMVSFSHLPVGGASRRAYIKVKSSCHSS